MAEATKPTDDPRQIAQRWCASRGVGWSLSASLGVGGTAPVFEVNTPDGPRALKIYDERFSTGEKGQIEEKRIGQQLLLKGHTCPYLVPIDDGGRFENRLFLLMGRAPGTELEKRLKDVPRNRIRKIVDQVARAAIFLKNEGLCHRDIKAANIFISDDFGHCTLLDISVIRNVADPIGVGTDHDGQLPIVATARYSPPEYLFRLLDPSPELWHALNVYQLGGLLHDLIMREPLFEEEFAKSKENRYRFAWIIAMTDPLLQADDVDRDLMLTARRALDKDWQRRSSVKLEEFLSDSNVQQAQALRVLGFGIARGPADAGNNVAARLQRIHEVSAAVEQMVTLHLRRNGVTARHRIQHGHNDTSKIILFAWDAPSQEPGAAAYPIEFRLDLNLGTKPDGDCLGLSVTLTMQPSGKATTLALPHVGDAPGVETQLLGLAVAALDKLAIEITRGDVMEAEV